MARMLLGMSGATDAIDSWLALYQQPQDRHTWGSSNWLCLLEKRNKQAALSLQRCLLAVMNSNCAGDNSDLQNSSMQMHRHC